MEILSADNSLMNNTPMFIRNREATTAKHLTMKKTFFILMAVILASICSHVALAETIDEKIARWQIQAEQGNADAGVVAQKSAAVKK